MATTFLLTPFRVCPVSGANLLLVIYLKITYRRVGLKIFTTAECIIAMNDNATSSFVLSLDIRITIINPNTKSFVIDQTCNVYILKNNNIKIKHIVCNRI